MIGVVVLPTAMLVAGCATGSDRQPEDKFKNSQAVRDEYASAGESFGAEFPTDIELPSLSDRLDRLTELADGPVTFESGYEDSVLVTIWRCGWQKSFLDAVNAGDAKAEARAGYELSSRYYELEAVKRWVDDPDRLWDRTVIQPALAGDLGPLEQDLENGCGEPFAP